MGNAPEASFFCQPGMDNASKLSSSLAIRGEIRADTVLTVEAAVEGSLRVPGHLLTIGPRGRVEADASAKSGWCRAASAAG